MRKPDGAPSSCDMDMRPDCSRAKSEPCHWERAKARDTARAVLGC